jgi:hypothetical protein
MIKMLGRILGLEKYGVKNENLILFPRKIITRRFINRWDINRIG